MPPEAKLFLACEKGDLGAIKTALQATGADKKAELLQATAVNQRTLLHAAAYLGHLEVVKYLVEQGANKEATDKDQRTPLHKAAERDKLDVVKYLVGQGAATMAEDRSGDTPAALAVKKGMTEVVKYLEGLAPSRVSMMLTARQTLSRRGPSLAPFCNFANSV